MELREIDISRIIRKELEQILKESLSISDEVLDISNFVFDNFADGVYDFNCNFKNLGDVRVIGELRDVVTPDEAAEGFFEPKSRLLKVYIPQYQGRVILRTVRKTIQHELEHAFQILKKIANGNYKNRYNIIYNQALETASDENASYYDRELARYFYCCSTFEQDAIVNELYVSIKEQRAYTMAYVAEIFKTSNAYKAYRTIIDVKTEMTDPEGHGSYREAIDKYGVSYQWVLNLGTNALQRLKGKIQNVVKRARKEVKEELASPHINLDAIFEK